MTFQPRSPIPFWFLNGPIDQWHVEREMRMMHDAGVSEVVVHPRYGLEVEYLSEDWFAIFGWCVDVARKLGMRLWIYDELNWPSGTAGLRVPKIDQRFQSKFLEVSEVPVAAIDLDCFEMGEIVVAANIECGNITKTRRLEDLSALSGLTGDWKIFDCRLGFDEYYVDTMNTDAVDCFKRLTYDEYKRRFGEEFGKTIVAVFTDEPSVYWASAGYDDKRIPFTYDLFETFEAAYGYDPTPFIPNLFYPGAESMAFRADFWQHVGRLFADRYHANLGGWCRRNGLTYTGHNNHEEPLQYQIRFQADAAASLREMDIPGVDHLLKQTLGNYWISIIGHKLCSSIAHVSGKPYAMSESFGAMDWPTTYADLRRVVNWQFALGINLLVPHALFHTISGPMKRESPPSFFYQSPHWDDFGEFARYVKRLESMLTHGRHICQVAVLYPITGLHASYQPDGKTPEFAHIDNFTNSLVLELVKRHVDFDFVDFSDLNRAEVVGGAIRLADEAYDTLIVPPQPYLRPQEVARLGEIAREGVTVHAFYRSVGSNKENQPTNMGGANFVSSDAMEALVSVLAKDVAQDIRLSGGGADEIMVYRRERDARPITFLVNRSEKHRKITAVLSGYDSPAIFDPETGATTPLETRKTGTRLQTQLRFHPNQAYFIVGSDADAAGREHVEVLPYGNAQQECRAGHAGISGFEGWATECADCAPSGQPNPETPKLTDVAWASFGTWVPQAPLKSRKTNPLPIGRDLKPHPIEAVSLTASVPFNVACVFDFEYRGPNGHPANVDVRDNPRYMPVNWAQDTPDFDAFAGTYEARFEIDGATEGIRLVLDRDYAECELYINDQQIELHPCLPEFGGRTGYLTDWFDVHADVSQILMPGSNLIRVVSPTKLSEPLRFVGDFLVRLDGRQIAICTETGFDRTGFDPEPDSGPSHQDPLRLSQTHPFFSGTTTYTLRFDTEELYSRVTLDLHSARDAVRVVMNGIGIGQRLWAPYEFDVTPAFSTGENTVTIQVRNNLANLLAGAGKPFGLSRTPDIIGWR